MKHITLTPVERGKVRFTHVAVLEGPFEPVILKFKRKGAEARRRKGKI